MRNLITLIVLLLLNPFISYNQTITRIKSATLGIELSVDSKLETNTTLIKNFTSSLDSFAITKNYRTYQGNAEVFYTKMDSLKAKLTQYQFTIRREGTTDFYKITKGTYSFLANIKSSGLALDRANGLQSPLQFASLLSYFILKKSYNEATTVTIKRMY